MTPFPQPNQNDLSPEEFQKLWDRLDVHNPEYDEKQRDFCLDYLARGYVIVSKDTSPYIHADPKINLQKL